MDQYQKKKKKKKKKVQNYISKNPTKQFEKQR